MKKLLLCSVLAAMCASALAGSLSVAVLDKEGKPVQDAIVQIFPSNKQALPKIPLPLQATISQEKMQFLPQVTLVSVGARLSFINNDSWDHHVRSSPAGMGQFNATQAGFEMRLEGKTAGKPSKPAEVTLDKAGALNATLLGCFIHGSMRGYVYASETPWAVKTNAEGLAVFDDLPDGAAQVKVWQADQLIDMPLRPYSVSATPGNLSMQLSVIPRRRRV